MLAGWRRGNGFSPALPLSGVPRPDPAAAGGAPGAAEHGPERTHPLGGGCWVLGTATTRVPRTYRRPRIYRVGLIPVSERSVTAWWSSWGSRVPLPAFILIYLGAGGRIPHPPAAPLLSRGSPCRTGCRGVGGGEAALRGQNSGLGDWEAQTKRKIWAQTREHQNIRGCHQPGEEKAERGP